MIDRTADFPIAVVDARDRSGAHQPLELEAGKPGDLADRLFERDLHLGKRGDRHEQRQFAVEHVVFADITMREHVVAEPLRVPETRAMAEHQPGVRAQHGDVVGHVARVGRTGPDVDQGDAAIAGLDEMKGRHLRHALGRGPNRSAAEARIAGHHVARPDEGFRTDLAGREALPARLRERIDIELVVREDHEILEVIRVGAGVVIEPAQRVIHARRPEQGERLGGPGRQLERAIGDRIIHRRKVRRIEHVAQQSHDDRVVVGAERAPRY